MTHLLYASMLPTQAKNDRLGSMMHGQLNLVDLAGSERVDRSV